MKVKKSKGASPSPTKKVHDEFNIRNESKTNAQEQLKKISEKFDLLEELQRQRDD